VPAKTLTAKILLYLSENPGATIKDLSQVFNVSPATIRNMIYRLRNNGYIEKAGNGFILTSKGEWFVTRILGGGKEEKEEDIRETKTSEVVEAKVEESVEAEEKTKTRSTEKTVDRDNLMERIEALEKEIENLKKIIEMISSEIKDIRGKLDSKTSGEEGRERKSEKKIEGLPKPVMNIREAMDSLGSLFDELRLEGRIEIIVSIVVDREFYEEFKKKFPLPIKEADALSPMEKMLLNEMIKDARVIVHAGKYYKLIS